jgi:hypothetical protein
MVEAAKFKLKRYSFFIEVPCKTPKDRYYIYLWNRMVDKERERVRVALATPLFDTAEKNG